MDKTIAIRVDVDFHGQITSRRSEMGLSLKEYITFLVAKDLRDCPNHSKIEISLHTNINLATINEAQKVLDFAKEVLSYGQ